MKILIKLGGTLLDDAESREAIARQLLHLSRSSELVVVHGGGKQVTRFLEERGVKSRFIGGLRVSDDSVIDAVTKVIAGTINKQLVAAMVAAGVAATGISGVDGALTSAVPLAPEFGLSGRPTGTSGHLLDVLLRAGYVPVVACVAGDANSNIYNVNADQMAVSCAAGWSADQLLFLTDVSGVKNQGGEVFPHLTPAEAIGLIQAGIAQGGMQAKLESAVHALELGVKDVAIAPGRQSNVCERLLAREAVGTRISFSGQASVTST